MVKQSESFENVKRKVSNEAVNPEKKQPLTYIYSRSKVSKVNLNIVSVASEVVALNVTCLVHKPQYFLRRKVVREPQHFLRRSRGPEPQNFLRLTGKMREKRPDLLPRPLTGKMQEKRPDFLTQPFSPSNISSDLLDLTGC